MKSVQFIFLGYAIAGTISMMLIGISIAERSLLGIGLSLISLLIIMGFGFKSKRKLKQTGRV